MIRTRRANLARNSYAHPFLDIGLREVLSSGHLPSATLARAARPQDPSTRESSEQATTVTVADLARDFAAAAPRLRVCYAAAYFAEVLRSSRYGGDGTGEPPGPRVS